MEALAGRDLPPGLGFEWTDMAYQQKLAANTRVEVPGVFEFRGDTTLLVFGNVLPRRVVFLGRVAGDRLLGARELERRHDLAVRVTRRRRETARRTHFDDAPSRQREKASGRADLT